MMHTTRRRPPKRQQRGISLIAAAALASALGAAAFASYVGIAAIRSSAIRSAQNDLLAKADAAIKAYASANGHLPCPAAQRGGDESCAGAGSTPRQKGWMPKAVADKFAAGGDSAEMLNLRYLVYRGTDPAHPDLAGNRLSFPSDPDYGKLSNGFDYCRNLATIHSGMGGVDGGLPTDGRSEEANPAYANVPADRPLAGGARAMNVAYGLAAPGTNGFTGANGDDMPHLESPSREQLPTYSESVLISDTRDAARNQSCAAGINSMNMLALADEWTKSVPPDRDAAMAHFFDLTILPLAITIEFWSGYAAIQVQSMIKDSQKVVEGIAAAGAKDAALCAANLVPACTAAAIQGGEESAATGQMAAQVREIAIVATRLATAAVNMTLAGDRQRQYGDMTIWTASESVLVAADKVGTEIPRAYP